MTSSPQPQAPKRTPVWFWFLIGAAALVGLIAVLGFLLDLLVPPITTARRSATANTIGGLSTALESFKSDWGAYPPSNPAYGGAKTYGFQDLEWFLMGPQGNGWGQSAAGALPFGGPISRSTFGPYYASIGGARGGGILDLYPTPRPILYFRAEPGRDPLFDVNDNPVDPTGTTGFASQRHFEMLVRPKDKDGNPRWGREDFLLISPGPDRQYGPVVGDKTTRQLRPAKPGEEAEATCDDITNIRK